MKNIEVKTSHGEYIDYEAAVNLMDFELAEQVHADGDQEPQAFYNNYCAAHLHKFGEEFEPNKINGQW